MRPAVDALLERVGQLYGTPVVIKDFFSDDAGHFGECEVGPEGVPVIRWNLPNNLIDETIAHELFHLELRTEGFPVFVLPETEETSLSLLEPVRNRFYQLNEPILHILIFKRMQALGLDPFAYTRKFYADAVERGDVEGDTDPLDRCLYYMRVELECDDQAMRDRIAEWFRQKNWQADMDKGKQLAEMIRVAEANTPEKNAVTLEAAANLLYQGQYVFRVAGWRERKKGQHTDREVVYSVEAVPG